MVSVSALFFLRSTPFLLYLSIPTSSALDCFLCRKISDLVLRTYLGRCPVDIIVHIILGARR